MRALIKLLLAVAPMSAIAQSGNNVPLVMNAENTFANYKKPKLPKVEDLPVIKELPNPLQGVKNYKDWGKRRAEIAAQIQHYGIGEKPLVKPEQVKAHMDGDTLIVDVTVNGQTLTLRSEIRYPKTGQAPYAVMIGTSGISLPRQLFNDRPIATMVFHEKQVNDYGQFGRHHERGEHNFDRLYPELKDNGAYSEWAWGLSRIIDGLQQLGPVICRKDGTILWRFRRASSPNYRSGARWRWSCRMACLSHFGRRRRPRSHRLPLVQRESAHQFRRRLGISSTLRST